MKKELNSLITTVVFFMTAISLQSKEIVINKYFFDLEVKSDKMILIDFPFKITGKQVLGKKESLKIETVDNSLYFKLIEGEADVSIWGGERAILLNLKAMKESEERRFNFINEKDFIEERKNNIQQWNHDTEIIAILEQFIDNKKAKDFTATSINEFFEINKKLQIVKTLRAKGKKYNIEIWNIINTSNKMIDLFDVSELHLSSERSNFAIESNTFNDRYLVPGQKTKAFVALREK